MTRQPVVLHVLEALEGGTARHLVDIATHATDSRHHVAIPRRRVGGLTDDTARPRLEAAGAAVHHLAMHRAPWSPANARALTALRRLIREVQPDVVHGHSSIGGLLARLATGPRRQPVVYTANGLATALVGVVAERALARRTTAFVATSASEAAVARRLGLDRHGSVVVIPNGIEIEAPAAPLDLREALAIPRDAPLVGSVSRLVPQKAPEDLVAAWAAVARRRPDAHFVLIGGGELEDRVEAAIDAHGLRSRLHRLVALERAGGVLGQLDVFSLASRFEGGPYAPLEAMRAGTAVVLTDVVGSRDAVVDGESGRLVPPGEPGALAAAITALLDDPAARHRLGAAARARVVACFDVRAMARSLEGLYSSLLAG